ncbi:TonB-dependent receptor [Pontibacter fetidus]|uniref:TonB-dependent receptor n=1 Tax=Pontibacter fetidus TaxID=2700082 RepID=A0A6B2H7J4_9BACT|nr:TonB-dependent receptor [Pontibacter fetidus]NDK56457.1 TonB-dependent receptor [Pontibacter fetidus]
MKKLYTCFLILICLTSWQALAQQQHTISGNVLDAKGEPIAGVNVYIKNSYDGASTGADGRFSFKTTATGTQTIVASFLGYETQEQTITIPAAAPTITFKLKEKFNQLNAVTITAGAFEAGDEKRSTILSSLDIATTAGATADIYPAINTLPGAQRVGEDGKLFVRGGDSHETQTFIDGLKVQKPYNSSVPDLPARGRFSPFMFSGTTFSSGGYSAEYGQALSSALLLKTNGLPEKTETGISIMSVGLGASHTKRWENTSLALTADYTNLAPYTSLIKQNIDWLHAPESKGGSAILRHQTRNGGMLKAYSSYSASGFELNQRTPDGSSHIRLNNRNFYSNATYQNALTEKWTLYTGLSYSANTDVIVADSQNIKDTDQATQGKLMLEHQLADPLWLKVGTELSARNYSQHYSESPAHETILADFTNYFSAVFTEADWYISKKLVARVGVRAENASALESINAAPRISLAYKTDAHGQISAAYGKFYQLPEAQFLKITDKLRSESATHYILNYQRQKDNRTFRVEGYYKKYDNLVKYNPEQPYLPGSYNNSGSGYAQGIDVFWRDRKTFKYADYWISYSLLDTRRNYKDYPQQAVPTFASKHNLSIVYKHFIPKLQTQVGATYSFASGRPYHNPNHEGFNQNRTPTYNDLSLNISYLTSLRGNFTIIYVSATNLLGNNHVYSYRYAATPDEAGNYSSLAVEPPSRHFLFAGVFINFGGNGIHH